METILSSCRDRLRTYRSPQRWHAIVVIHRAASTCGALPQNQAEPSKPCGLRLWNRLGLKPAYRGIARTVLPPPGEKPRTRCGYESTAQHGYGHRGQIQLARAWYIGRSPFLLDRKSVV